MCDSIANYKVSHRFENLGYPGKKDFSRTSSDVLKPP